MNNPVYTNENNIFHQPSVFKYVYVLPQPPFLQYSQNLDYNFNPIYQIISWYKTDIDKKIEPINNNPEKHLSIILGKPTELF